MNKNHPSITLRDYFAATAKGLDLHSVKLDFIEKLVGYPAPSYSDTLAWARFYADADARLRYIQADAMLIIRKENNN